MTGGMIAREFAGSFGCEVSPSQKLEASPAVVAEITRLIRTHLLVVIRGQSFTPAEQVAFTEAFGACEQPWEVFAQHPDDRRIHVLSTSKVPRRPYRTSSQHWHCDRSFLPTPTWLTLLHAVCIPVEQSDTIWVDTRAAYQLLSPELRRRIEGRLGVHDYGWKFHGLLARRVGPEAADAEKARFPPVEHPLVMVDPTDGRHSLYLSELCLAGIAGAKDDTALGLIDDLMAHALRSPTYRHPWRQGDLVIWDNSATMHRNVAHTSDGARLLHRTSVPMRRTW